MHVMVAAMNTIRMILQRVSAWSVFALAAALATCATILSAPTPVAAQAQISPFSQALAEAAAEDRDIAAFYRNRAFAPLWTGASETHAARRAALLTAMQGASTHGLPADSYDTAALLSRLSAVEDARSRAAAEVLLSQTFLAFARDLQTGILEPRTVDPGLVLEVPLRDRTETLTAFAAAEPRAFLRGLAPQGPEYARLVKARMTLDRVIRAGGWGLAVSANRLAPGDSGGAVVALRDRLVAMGYLPRSATRVYDAALQTAVQTFQADHGLETDGVAGTSTLRAINVSAEERLQSVLVAMERERWLNRDLGARHILVNLTDFSARVIDDGRETFRTRAVIGKNTSDRRTPEFSDVMDHMVINPSWNVPRSITTKEYLPKLQRNRNAVSHLQVIDSRGRVVPRGSANFSAYTARTFPYRLKQPPSTRNALGLVKFMFPNKYNIYLHDTPAKDLFAREVRAYSHGCVRLQRPFEFAHTLLAPQEADPEGFFQATLDTGRETRVDMEEPVPVHITYRTAFTDAKGRVHYRNDIYGRDAAIWRALSRVGVSLGVPRG
jgi:murein L,D-transpeptidase YcbB/YkuD